MVKYRMRVSIRILGEENMKRIRDAVKAFLTKEKTEGNIELGAWGIVEEPPVELYKETGEV